MKRIIAMLIVLMCSASAIGTEEWILAEPVIVETDVHEWILGGPRVILELEAAGGGQVIIISMD